jgi:hypothetical protein
MSPDRSGQKALTLNGMLGYLALGLFFVWLVWPGYRFVDFARFVLFAAVTTLTCIAVFLVQEARREARERTLSAAAAEVYKQALRTCAQCQSTEFAEVTRARKVHSTTTETRTTRHYNADDEYRGYSEEDVEVPIVYTVDESFRVCERCKHEWRA